MLDYLKPVTDDVLDVSREVHIGSQTMREKDMPPMRIAVDRSISPGPSPRCWLITPVPVVR